MTTGSPQANAAGRMASIAIRQARPTDAGAIARIYIAAREATMTYLPNLYSRSEIRQWIVDDVLAQCDVTLGCTRTMVAGFSAVRRDWLEQLYVHPDLQNDGVGSVLVDTAKKASNGILRIHVFQQNLRARTFYARHGFTVERLRDSSENGEGVPDMVCVWRAKG
jgi:GNAT superfamily N-acetyltransferase